MRKLQRKSYSFISTIQNSLMSLIPILMIGSFSLLLFSIEIPAYQNFIHHFAGGILYKFFNVLYEITFQQLSLYMVASIAFHTGMSLEYKLLRNRMSMILVALGCFFIITDFNKSATNEWGPSGMFTAIFATWISLKLYVGIHRFLTRKKKRQDDTIDLRLIGAIQAIFPMLLTFLVFMIFSLVVTNLLSVTSVNEVPNVFFNSCFLHITGEFLQGLVFVLVSSLLWFVGIHGSDVLQGVSDRMLTANINENIAQLASGSDPTHILTKPFIDSFVLLGGCGSAMCLLIALFIFGKRGNHHRLAKYASFPMLFNINEIMVFGLPIIFNVDLFIPFIGVPVINYIISYLATFFGFVPLTTEAAVWSTPIFANSYINTGSVAGCVLQVVNLTIGVLLYYPFIKKYEAHQKTLDLQRYEDLVELVKMAELRHENVNLMKSHASSSHLARELARSFMLLLNHDELNLYYQPQYDATGNCVGAEALLRWNHPTFGMIYPPLAVKLASEADLLMRMDTKVVETGIKKAAALKEAGHSISISVNVSGSTIQTADFEKILKELSRKYDVPSLPICLEVTEQAVLIIDNEMLNRFGRIHDMGYELAIDDFSMGSTSLSYLVGNSFGELKLDGKLVRESKNNPRAREIIRSITTLSDTLQMDVTAEFVSDKEILDLMIELGCEHFQGFYYSPAIEWETFLMRLEKETSEKISKSQSSENRES